MKSRPLRWVLRGCAIVVVNIVFAVGLLELALIAFPGLMPVRSTERLTLEGGEYWRLRPSIEADLSSACWESHIRTNAWGTRDLPVDTLLEKREAWLFAGDSLVQGLEVDNAALFTSRLQERLPEVAIINMGKSGSGPAEYNVFLQWHFAKRLHPRITRAFVFFYLGNDFKNLVESEYAAEIAPTVPVAAPPLVSPPAWLASLRSWQALELLEQRVTAWIYGEDIFRRAEVLFIDSDLFDEATERLRATLRALKVLADDNSVAVTIVSLPSVQNVMAGPEARSFTEPIDALRRASAGANLPFIDLATELLLHARTQRLKFPYYSFNCDGHFSPGGHAAVADLLLPHLSSQASVATTSALGGK